MSRSCSSAPRVLSVALASAVACAAVSLVPRDAHAAGFDLGIDGDANALLAPSPNQNNLSTMGGGFKLRFGDHMRFRGGLNLTPEVGYAFDHVFAGNTANEANAVPENMNRFFAGVRLGVGRNVVPTIYGHIGYGFRSVSNSDGSNAGIKGDNGLALDTGIAVEFRIARHLSIGPHVEFVYIDVPNAPEWLTFGGHLDFIF